MDTMTRQQYQVLQPVHLHGKGTLKAGDTVSLHPRQAVFLLTGGVLAKGALKPPSRGKAREAKS